MKRYRLLILLLILPLTLLAQQKEEKQFNDVRFEAVQPLFNTSTEGLSGHFAGLSENYLLVAGGCNFPEVPAALGGAKKYYDIVLALAAPLSGKQWVNVGRLPKPLAYGVSISTPEGVVCIGGTQDGKVSEKSVFLLQMQKGKLSIKTLPDLPIGLDQMAGAFGDGYIYVAGGQTNGRPSNKAFRLSMGHTSQGWKELSNLPGAGRVQSCGAVQNGALGPLFYVFGGFDPTTNLIADNGLVYNPKRNTWETTSRILPEGVSRPQALVGAQAVVSGSGHILFFGGVNREIFQQAIQRGKQLAEHPSATLKEAQTQYMLRPAAWYQFNDHILVYQTITDSWARVFQNPRIARAGAAVVPFRDGNGQQHWIVVDGESKPGIRSADVTAVTMTYTARFGWLNWAVLIAYLIAMIALGFYFMRRQKGGEDFFKGGGRIPWWAAGISIFATMLSAITYMSIPAKAYATDWTYYPMQICILLISFPVIKYFLPFFRRLNVTTAYEYLERRFNYTTRLLASLLFIVFMVARTALVLFLPSLAMTAVTGINIYICIVLMAAITIVYCTMGGVEAVVWGDVIQGIILVGGAFLAAGYLIVNTGQGADDFFRLAWDNDKFRLFDWSFDYRNACFWVVILGGLANNLISYTSDQTVIQRYLTTKDERSAARGILTNGLMSVFVTIAFFTIGTGLYTFFKTHPAAMDMTMAKTDAIFPFFMMSQLPVGLAGLLIAAVFAATMSTIASNINSVSTAFTIDLYKKLYPSLSSSTTLRVARVAGVVTGVVGMLIAILMATVNIQSLLDYFNTILGLLSGGIGGLFLMGIFFPRIGARAALIGFLCGTAAVFYMNFLTSLNFLLFGFVSMGVSVLVAYILSFLFPESNTLMGLTWKTLDKSVKS